MAGKEARFVASSFLSSCVCGAGHPGGPKRSPALLRGFLLLLLSRPLYADTARTLRTGNRYLTSPIEPHSTARGGSSSSNRSCVQSRSKWCATRTRRLRVFVTRRTAIGCGVTCKTANRHDVARAQHEAKNRAFDVAAMQHAPLFGPFCLLPARAGCPRCQLLGRRADKSDK